LNEEKRVSYAIRNLISYGDVMIMDAGSTDNTKNIAERLGARFFLRPPSDNLQVETQQNFEFIKKRILNMKRMTTVCFIIEDLSDIDRRLDSFETIEDIHDDFGKLDYLDFDLSTLSEKAYPSASINDISRQINQAVSIFLQNKPSGTTQEQQVISC